MTNATQPQPTLADDLLFGTDPTPGIVSVWADRSGHARVWQRLDGRVTCTRTTYRTWLLATHLHDLPQADPDPHATISVRELDGPPHSYRYLVSARPGLNLERAVLAGAARRGQTAHSIADLGDTYYGVGPVEQYLMQTGRVYFRGLRYSDLHRLQFDLETTALDPQQGRIFMVAIRDSRGFESTLEAPTVAEEAQLIADLCAIICDRDPDVIENHNLFGFDLPFLEARAARLHVPLWLSRSDAPARLERYIDPHGRGPLDRRRKRLSIPGRELIDTLDAVRRYDFAARDLPSHRLKDVARHFGVASPDRTYLAGASIFDTYQFDPDTVRRYALDDVAEVDALSQRLLHAPFALAGMAPRCFERLASAGPAMGILEPMLVRAYLQAGAALPYNASADDPPDPHAGGGLHLFAAGIAEHVVKADVASLYPSIMRTYAIGPQCDRRGVLLHLVDRLTELRLQHKAAAREAVPGSIEHGVHHGNQAAMKVLINSAYGYLGAGRMALFADRRAADEVTRHGRAVLDRVVAGLRERGVALIEADTDGVYFAVPPRWTETDERALVSEVAATLPTGIQLEYEGHYRAMFSHEVKNYALLSYTDDLILRGVALRSSRSEPFGDRFLRDALRCLMQGDIVGVRRVFLETIHALRDRVLPASDLAARMRLSKTPQAYAASRQNHREQQYEALLNAGRADWTPGERVRVYRRVAGDAVWLPDAADESAIDERIAALNDARDYDVAHYESVLVTSYAGRLRKAFAPADWEQVFRTDQQPGLFDEPLEQIEPVWIRCSLDQQPAS